MYPLLDSLCWPSRSHWRTGWENSRDPPAFPPGGALRREYQWGDRACSHIPNILLLFFCTLSCVKCTLSVRHQPTFQPMMRMEKGSCTRPHPALYQRHPPCLQNKVCVGQTEQMQAVMSIVNHHCVHSGADRWPSSPLSRSPAPDRRILTSSVPASPTNPMRRLILSPSPLTQSEYAAQITTASPHPDILPHQF